MKRTFTINLNNVVYHIDNDAFDLLRGYLDEVEARLSPEEKKEVMADIEARISELFTEKLQKGKDVINISDVEEVIAILGKPNQFTEDEDHTQSAPPPAGDKKTRKKFYRDVDNAVLGGVAAGLAALLGWDVVLVRILLVVIVFLGYGTIIPIYLIVWLITPPARTIAQKLEMQGVEATAERIKQEFNNLKNYVESDKFRESASNAGNRIGEVFGAIFKAIFVIFGAIMGFVGFILLGVLLLLLSFFIFEPAFLSGYLPEIQVFTGSGLSVALFITLTLMIGIPIFALIVGAVRILSGRKGGSAGPLSWILTIIWFLSLFVFAGLSARLLTRVDKISINNMDINWSFDRDNSPAIHETRVVEPFSEIEVAGNIKLDLTQDSVSSLQIRCQPSVMPYLITETENGVLKIYTRKLFVNRDIKVHVVNPQFNKIKAEGATEIRSFGKIRSENMHVQVSGISKADLDVQVSRDMNLSLSGASKVEIQGLAYSLTSNSSGTTKIEADNFLVRNARVNASGASDIELNVTDSLFADLTGASSFSYVSRPLYINERSLGASKVQRR
jgi:phage shock protein PspC (stress-responsive transcriptional regulator)